MIDFRMCSEIAHYASNDDTLRRFGNDLSHNLFPVDILRHYTVPLPSTEYKTRRRFTIHHTIHRIRAHATVPTLCSLLPRSQRDVHPVQRQGDAWVYDLARILMVNILT